MATDYEQRYIDQLRQRALEINRARRANQSEGSTEWTASDQDVFDRTWDGISLADAMRQHGGNFESLSDNRFNELSLAEDDPLIAQFREQYGEQAFTDENGNPVEAPDSGNAAATGYMMGFGDPTYGDYQGRDILQDAGRILRLPDGRYIREAANLNSGEIAGAQREDETQHRRMRQRGAVMALAVLGAGIAGGALAGGEAAAGATGAAEVGMEGLAAGGAGAGLTPASYAGLGGEFAAGAGAAGGGLVSGAAPGLEVPANLAYEPIAAANPALAATPEISGGGWMSGLSPASRSLLTRAGLSAASTGASALLQANAAEDAQEARRGEEERARDDRIRRGQVAPARPNQYTARPSRASGLIASRMRGG